VLSSGRIEITKALTATEREKERSSIGKLVSLNSQIAREGSRAKPDPARIESLKGDLQKARLDHEAIQTALYAAHPELKVRRGNAEPLKFEDAARLLPGDDSALLEYVVTEERTFLFVLSASSHRRASEVCPGLACRFFRSTRWQSGKGIVWSGPKRSVNNWRGVISDSDAASQLWELLCGLRGSWQTRVC
jgi:hypothetical protein